MLSTNNETEDIKSSREIYQEHVERLFPSDLPHVLYNNIVKNLLSSNKLNNDGCFRLLNNLCTKDIEQSIICIGRVPSCTIVCNNNLISRVQCFLVICDNQVYVFDKWSRIGTTIKLDNGLVYCSHPNKYSVIKIPLGVKFTVFVGDLSVVTLKGKKRNKHFT